MKFSDAFIGTAVLLLVLVYATIYAVPAKADEPTIDTYVGPVMTVITCRPVIDASNGVDPGCKIIEYTMDKPMEFCELVAERLNLYKTQSSTITATCEFQH